MIEPDNTPFSPVDDSTNQIVAALNQNLLDHSLENYAILNGHKLLTDFKPRYENPNKVALLNDVLEKKQYIPSKRNLLLTRFSPKPVPSVYTFEQHNDPTKELTFIANVFDYLSTDESSTIDWYMNFANHDIFSYYYSSLLAQDELQVLECPQLASIRERLLKENDWDGEIRGKKVFDTHVMQDGSPYPILISNIERVIDLNTTNLYGHKFSMSDPSTVLKEYTYLKPPQMINILAIEAPKYGYGSYTTEQIQYILQTCFTGYSAAKFLANITYELSSQNQGLPSREIPLKTNIHTGWFGCGAYGGNRTLMIVLQVLAAKMAAIDKLIFHTVIDDCQPEIDAAKAYLNSLFADNPNPLSLEKLIEKIANGNFQWGLSNGT